VSEPLLAGDLSAAPAALNLLESRSRRAEAEALVRAAGEGAGHIIGITGPPGSGKSTLLSALGRAWRAQGRTVAILAVDPSSKRSGGALLGDRARIEHDPADRGLFIRSMAAGERLGGLAPATRAAATVLAAAFDVVVIETVGVGQSETEVAEVADTVAVVVPPAAGDALQYMKAGIMEVPDVLVATKADLGRAPGLDTLGVPCIPTHPPQGVEELIAALDAHRASLDLAATRARARRAGALADFVSEYGESGLRALGGRRAAEGFLKACDPSSDGPTLLRLLEERRSSAEASQDRHGGR
jgi:LAO/AO transport system kinase